MKRIIAIILSLTPIFLVVFIQNSDFSRSPASQKIKHIVFDLDGTLVESLGYNVPGDIVLDSGEAYHLFANARELVEKVWRQGLQVHFYSGGPNSRNIDLLSKLKISTGQSFADISTSILGQSDLTDLGEEIKGENFTDRYRKDLTKIGELDELVIFEDNKYFPLNKVQRKRVLELPIHDGGALKAWRQEQRLAWAYQIIDEVVEGKDLSIINKENINENIVKGMRQLNRNVNGELSRHGCTGIFYALSF